MNSVEQLRRKSSHPDISQHLKNQVIVNSQDQLINQKLVYNNNGDIRNLQVGDPQRFQPVSQYQMFNQHYQVNNAPEQSQLAQNQFRNNQSDNNYVDKNILLFNELEVQDGSGNDYRSQYPYCCAGMLKQEENPDDLFAEALLVGPYHIIVLASQMKKLIVTSDQNITKRLYFQHQGQEINVKDFFLNSSNSYAIALLEKDIGSQYGYLGIINAKINYYINQQYPSNQKNNLINFSHPQKTYDISDITFKQLKVICQQTPFENDSFQQLPTSNSPNKGWFLIKDESLGYCIIGYSQINTIPFINTSQVERWMSSSDQAIPSDNFSFVAPAKMDIKQLNDSTIQKAHSSGIYKICRINHETVVSSSCDNQIKFWNPFSGFLTKNYKNDECCRNFCLSEDQQYLFGTCDNYIFRMKWRNNYEIDKVFTCQDKIYSICKIKVDEKTGHDIIGSGDSLGNIYVIDGTTMQQIHIIHNSNNHIHGHSSSINSICRINNNQIATAGGGGQLKIWMWEDGILIKALEGHNTQKNIYFVDKHPEKENQIITASSDQTIRVWDILTGQQVKKIQVNNSIYCAAFLNEFEFAVGDFNLIRIFNLRTWQYKKIEKHTCRINTICSLNERTFLSGDIEGNIFLFSFDEANQDPEILIEGIQGDSKISENFTPKQTLFNKTYKIVQPTFQQFVESSQIRRTTDQELSFERVENQSVKNPESAQKYSYEMNSQNKQYPYQNSIAVSQQSSLVLNTPLKTAAFVEKNNQSSQNKPQTQSNYKMNQYPYQQEQFGGNENQNNKDDLIESTNENITVQKSSNNYDIQSKTNFPQIKEMLSGQKYNNSNMINNNNFLFSEKKDFSYNYKNPYVDNNNQSLVNNMNPMFSKSQSEKKNERKTNQSFDMEPIKKENALVMNSQDFSYPVNVVSDSIENYNVIGNNVHNSQQIAQKLIGAPITIQKQQQQQIQQIMPSNPFERKRSNSVVKNTYSNEEVQHSQILNIPQSNGSQPQIFSNNNIPQNQIVNQSTLNDQYGRVVVVPRSQSAARLNTSSSTIPNPQIPKNNQVGQFPNNSYYIGQSNISQIGQNNNINNSLVGFGNTNTTFNSPTPQQQFILNNIINSKINSNPSTLKPNYNPVIQNSIQQTQNTQISQQQINSGSAQKDQQQLQNLSSENLQRVSLIGQSNSKESFGQKVRSFTRTPEKNPSQSPILQIQQKNMSNQPTQYRPSILRDRNQGSIDLGSHNQSMKNENNDSSYFQIDSKIKQTYENHILHLKSEIQKLEESTENKNELISSLTKEKSEMFEIISQLKKETELIKQNHERENKKKLDVIQCSNKLSELNMLNDELIKKITHYQEQEQKNQQVISDLVESNNSLNNANENHQQKNAELESIIFQLKQQIQEKDQRSLSYKNQIQDLENENNLVKQKLQITQRYNEEEVRNLQKQLEDKEKYIATLLKGQQNNNAYSLNDQNKQNKMYKYFSDKESISEINPFETEQNRTNTYQDNDSIFLKIEKEDDKQSAKFMSNQENDQQSKDLKEKYKKIEIMASLRSAQDEALNVKAQLQKLRQEYGEKIELTDKYNQLNESFKQKTKEVDNWHKIYNEIYGKQ